jgi:hypothetical protein
VDVCENPVGSIDVVFCDVLPNLGEICEGIGMEGVRPLVVARSFSFFLAVSGVTCTSMSLLYGFGDRPGKWLTPPGASRRSA